MSATSKGRELWPPKVLATLLPMFDNYLSNLLYLLKFALTAIILQLIAFFPKL